MKSWSGAEGKLGSMGVFSLVLATAKAYLEHDIELMLIVDHAPDAQAT